MTLRLRRPPALLLLLGLLLPAAGQGEAPAPTPPGIPDALRGAWSEGESCARPEALLFLTARSAARLPAEGAPVLLRFEALGAAPGGWTLGTSTGPQAPRLALRSPEADRLETAEPAPKTRDDRLPGEGAILRRWRRCAPIPAALHAEGVAVLAALEHVEAVCGPEAGLRDCLAALLAQADVTGDGMLGVAELARLGRGAAWIAAVREGRAVDADVAARAATGALRMARGLLEGLDYDGDGRLSLAELAQDRGALGATAGAAAGGPFGGAGGMAALRDLPGAPPWAEGTGAR